MSRLLVVAWEPISGWIAKGEVIDRYYNPENVFEEVAVLLLDPDDRPDPAAVQMLAGQARVEVERAPIPSGVFVETLGWRPALLRRRLARVVDAARALRPDVVRTYGAHLDAWIGSEMRRRDGTPLVVSLHINPDVDVRRRPGSLRTHVSSRAVRAAERTALRTADLVLPVYRSIVPYLEAQGVERYKVAYNVLNPTHLVRKTDYARHGAGRVICVGRQFREKDPSQIVRALALLPGVELTVVGDGPYHARLESAARAAGVAARVSFRRSMPSAALCRALSDHDVAAVHSEYWELSKTVLEALLSGVPLVANRRHRHAVPELTPDLCLFVENTAEGFAAAIGGLLADDSQRAERGRHAAERAWAQWGPPATEAAFANVYRRLLGVPPNVPAP